MIRCYSDFRVLAVKKQTKGTIQVHILQSNIKGSETDLILRFYFAKTQDFALLSAKMHEIYRLEKYNSALL